MASWSSIHAYCLTNIISLSLLQFFFFFFFFVILEKMLNELDQLKQHAHLGEEGELIFSDLLDIKKKKKYFYPKRNKILKSYI